MLNKIILGTANFNKNYGINKSRLNPDNLKILKFVQKKGINIIDFAPKYFYDENSFNYIKAKNFKIISKIPSIKKIKKKNLNNFIKKQIKKNLDFFKCKSIYCMLFHNSKDFNYTKIKEAIKILHFYKKKKIIKKIGVSVYNPTEINKILNYFKPFKPDIIQLPMNIYDNRFEKTGVLKTLKKLNINIHVRSIFLQGLVFRDRNKLPKYFNKWKNKLKINDNFDNVNNIYNICFNYIKKKKIDKIIIGFKYIHEVKAFFLSLREKNNVDLKIIKPINDEKLVNPSLWKI